MLILTGHWEFMKNLVSLQFHTYVQTGKWNCNFTLHMWCCFKDWEIITIAFIKRISDISEYCFSSEDDKETVFGNQKYTKQQRVPAEWLQTYFLYLLTEWMENTEHKWCLYCARAYEWSGKSSFTGGIRIDFSKSSWEWLGRRQKFVEITFAEWLGLWHCWIFAYIRTYNIHLYNIHVYFKEWCSLGIATVKAKIISDNLTLLREILCR